MAGWLEGGERMAGWLEDGLLPSAWGSGRPPVQSPAAAGIHTYLHIMYVDR